MSASRSRGWGSICSDSRHTHHTRGNLNHRHGLPGLELEAETQEGQGWLPLSLPWACGCRPLPGSSRGCLSACVHVLTSSSDEDASPKDQGHPVTSLTFNTSGKSPPPNTAPSEGLGVRLQYLDFRDSRHPVTKLSSGSLSWTYDSGVPCEPQAAARSPLMCHHTNAVVMSQLTPMRCEPQNQLCSSHSEWNKMTLRPAKVSPLERAGWNPNLHKENLK